MEKHELLSILYSERQRLAAKYTSPGWNYWVLFGALMSCILYFLDLNPLKNFVWENVTTATGFLIIVLVIPSVFYMVYRKKDKEFYDGVLAKVSKPDRRYIKWIAFSSTVLFLVLYYLLLEYILPDILNLKYPVILIIALVLIYIVCLYGYIFNIFYKLEINLYISVILSFCFITIMKVFYLLCARNFTGLESKFSIIIIAFFSILYLLFSMSKSDLSSIDKLIDNTIDNQYVDAESTLKLLRIITIDYSIKSIYDEQIKNLISIKTSLDIQLKEIDDSLFELKSISILNSETKHLMYTANDKCVNGNKLVSSYIEDINKILKAIRKANTYVQKNTKKQKQLNEIAETIFSIASNAEIALEKSEENYLELNKILSLHNKKLNITASKLKKRMVNLNNLKDSYIITNKKAT